MKKFAQQTLCLLAFSSLLLSSCNLPAGGSPSPTPDQVATQVVLALTAIPSAALPQPTSTPAVQAATATVEPTATQTASPTPEPTATATISPEDPRTRLGTPTWQDKFENANSIGTFDETETKAEVRDGMLVLTAKNANGYHGWSLAYHKVDQAYIEATIQTGECSGGDRYGLVFRAPDFENNYLFGFSCDGRFDLRKWTKEGVETLQTYQASSAINAGPNQTNRIGIETSGSRFVFYANGIKIGETSDSSFDKGMFGIFIASANTPGFTIKVDDLAYWTLP